MFAVPADASWKKTARATGRVFFVERPLDAPIVWNVELAPSAVIKCRRFGVGRIFEGKEPIVVHRNFVARVFSAVRLKHKLRCGQQQRKDGEHADHRVVVDFESSNSRRTQSYMTPWDQLSAWERSLMTFVPRFKREASKGRSFSIQ